MADTKPKKAKQRFHKQFLQNLKSSSTTRNILDFVFMVWTLVFAGTLFSEWCPLDCYGFRQLKPRLRAHP